VNRLLLLTAQHGRLAAVARGLVGVEAVTCTGNAATVWSAASGLMAPYATAAATKRHELRPEEATVG
jgi:hypothetical protein